MNLRSKALLVLVAVAAGPLAVAGPMLATLNERVLLDNEKQRQSAMLGEAAGLLRERLTSARVDAEVVAGVLAGAAQAPAAQGDGLDGVRATLASRKSFEAVRFEVPAARVDTVLRREGTSGNEPPPTSNELRSSADASGFAFALTGPKQATLVVPVPTSATGKQGARGYVAVAIPVDALRSELGQTALQRFDDPHVTLLLVDDQRHVIASAGSAPLGQDDDARALPVLGLLPTSIPREHPVSSIQTLDQGGERVVASVRTVPELGWALALWRPEREVYAVLRQMRERVGLIALGAAVLAALVALGASRTITRPVLRLVDTARRLGRRDWTLADQPPERTDELGELETAIGSAARDLRQGEAELLRQQRVRDDLGRFLSRDLVDQIVRGEHSLALGGRRREITVIFADVVAFTPLAESRSPEQVVALLNELFSLLTEIVFRHGGTVDKFIGDCLMAVWGAADDRPDHATRALEAAADMMRFLETANEDWKTRYDVEVRLGIGVNSGAAIVGNVGSDKRMEFTAIGDVVNVAARLEGLATPGQILVAEGTHALVDDGFDLTLLGERRLTGRAASTRVYSLEP